MNNRSLVNTIITAAIVVVILPLLIMISTVCAGFGLELTGASGIGMFGAMGTPHVLMLLWTVVAVAIVASLIALLARDNTRQHA
jgi:hypothetical protein